MSHSNSHNTDVAIIGGGLAGLTLAIQLKQRDPTLHITVIERRSHPVPEAAFKVGESTVEIGAHYFADILGLQPELETNHIRKFGFRFFFNDKDDQIDACTELGVSQLLPTPSWQIDRGRFENFLGERVREMHIDFWTAATVKTIQLSDDESPHQITFEADQQSYTLSCRWLVDASGRAGLLKRKLDLAQPNGHDIQTVWWRVEGHINPNDWSNTPKWLSRCTPPDRWRSTNHLCGEGYWLWLIPLSSGAHSVGIVFDPKYHSLDQLNTYEKVLEWVQKHQPQLAETLNSGKHPLLDFNFFKNVSYGCREVFSSKRWAITGEAGVFLDPFYSPGSDFIAISNTYITDLIHKDRSQSDPSFELFAHLYQQLYFSFYDNTLTLYRDQYGLFGNSHIMPIKVIWDYTYYWALLAPLYFSENITNLHVLAQLKNLFTHASSLNDDMQKMFKQWGELAGSTTDLHDHRLLDQYKIDWFYDLNKSLMQAMNDDAFVTKIRLNLNRLDWLAIEIAAHAQKQCPALDTESVASHLRKTSEHEPSLSSAWYAEEK